MRGADSITLAQAMGAGPRGYQFGGGGGGGFGNRG